MLKKVSFFIWKDPIKHNNIQPTTDAGIELQSSNKQLEAGEFIRFMHPSSVSLSHPMADLLLEYATKGYRLNYGRN